LPISDLAGQVTMLSLRRGASLRAANWHRGPNRNALDSLSCSTVITAPDDRVALHAEVMIALPNAMDSSVVTCAELRIADLAAWADALHLPITDDLRLSLEEVTEFFMVVWQTATEQLARVVTSAPEAMRWAPSLVVELRLTAERPFDTSPAPQPILDEYVDINPLGRSDRAQIPEMAVTITAPPLLSQDERRALTRKALAHMAQQFGFIEATTVLFRHALSRISASHISG
jgi:hypothetical protein